MLKFRVVLLPILAVAIVLTAAMPVNSATGPTTGTRNVAVILMNQPNTCNKSHRKCPHPWPKGAATRDMGFRPYQNHHSSVDEWFRLASGGQLRITGRVFGPWNTDGSMAYTNTATGQGNRRACNLNNWLAAVARAAEGTEKLTSISIILIRSSFTLLRSQTSSALSFAVLTASLR